MSQENVDLIREGYEDMNRGDFDAALARMDRQVIWENDPGGPEGATRYVGHARVRQFWDDFLGVWDRYRFEPQDVVAVGPNLILVPVLLNAWLPGSPEPVSMHTTYLWTIREGKAVHVRLFFEHTAALEAAGLRE